MTSKRTLGITFPGKELFIEGSLLPRHAALDVYEKLYDNFVTSVSGLGYELVDQKHIEGYSVITLRRLKQNWETWNRCVGKLGVVDG